MDKIHFFKHKALSFKPVFVVGSYVDRLGNVFYVVDIDYPGFSLRFAFRKLSSVLVFFDSYFR